jgi:RNA 2',3'-cyclic 3'-phosphodiesterase
MARSFFALWPETSVASELHALGDGLEAVCGGRRMRVETLHVTLAFIGESSPDQLETLCDIGRRLALPACELSFDHFGRFARKSIVWAGCAALPSELAAHVHALHEMVHEAGFALEDRTFVPHVTLLRNAAVGPLPDFTRAIRWPVTEWRLAVSHTDATGARYRAAESWSISA